MKNFALVDCNNFFVSCERVFNPKLIGKPVVVLSSNDACVIARSNEAKAIGIKMGEPAYMCKDIFKRYNVIALSANFTLYSDMSNRVMQTLAKYSTDIEVYSIDEAFLYLPKYTDIPDYFTHYSHFMKKKVKQHTGIPVSIGIAPTKTLAKVASHIAKKSSHHQGVFDIANINDEILKSFKIEDVWGIGYRYKKLLHKNNVFNVYDFKNLKDSWVKENMKIPGLKTLHELRGISCIELDDSHENKKSIMVSRAFGRNVTDINDLKEALSIYITSAAQKLRKQNQICGSMTIIACYTNFMDSQRFYNFYTIPLSIATSYTPTLISMANLGLEKIFKKAVNYKKIGIRLDDFYENDFIQMNSLVNLPVNLNKQSSIIKVIDNINSKLGPNKVCFAVSKNKNSTWQTKKEMKSPSFTTSWKDILTIKI